MILICEEWAVLEKVDQFFFSVHLHHNRNGPGNFPCLLVLGKIGISIYFWSTSKLQSFQPALDLKLKFLVWGLLSTCKPGLPGRCCKVTKLGVICPNPLFVRTFLLRCSSQDLLIFAMQKMFCVSSACRSRSHNFFGKCWYSNLFCSAKPFSNLKITS